MNDRVVHDVCNVFRFVFADFWKRSQKGGSCIMCGMCFGLVIKRSVWCVVCVQISGHGSVVDQSSLVRGSCFTCGVCLKLVIDPWVSIHVYICMYARCVCVCVCVRAREGVGMRGYLFERIIHDKFKLNINACVYIYISIYV